jgi:hypothetical protein
MSQAVPEMRKSITKLKNQLEVANELIMILRLEKQEIEKEADRYRLLSDLNSRIFIGFLMDARSITELRSWFANFLEEVSKSAKDESLSRSGARELLEKHGVHLRIPEIKEIRSGIWEKDEV